MSIRAYQHQRANATRTSKFSAPFVTKKKKKKITSLASFHGGTDNGGYTTQKDLVIYWGEPTGTILRSTPFTDGV